MRSEMRGQKRLPCPTRASCLSFPRGPRFASQTHCPEARRNLSVPISSPAPNLSIAPLFLSLLSLCLVSSCPSLFSSYALFRPVVYAAQSLDNAQCPLPGRWAWLNIAAQAVNTSKGWTDQTKQTNGFPFAVYSRYPTHSAPPEAQFPLPTSHDDDDAGHAGHAPEIRDS